MPKELFVAKIPPSVTIDALRDLFNSVAPVALLKRPRDHETGELRSYAFITMQTEEGAETAITQLNGYQIDGQSLVVKESDKPFVSTPLQRPPAAHNPAPAPSGSDFDWDERENLYNAMMDEVGGASTSKVTVVGRPAKVYENGNTVLALLQFFPRASVPLPKGVPAPPGDAPTYFAVYIGGKQWRKVAEALQADPSDVMIAEGMAVFDPDIPGIAVFATSLNSRALQMAANAAKRESQGG